jgi:hypothetical protein
LQTITQPNLLQSEKGMEQNTVTRRLLFRLD